MKGSREGKRKGRKHQSRQMEVLNQLINVSGSAASPQNKVLGLVSTNSSSAENPPQQPQAAPQMPKPLETGKQFYWLLMGIGIQ